MAYKVERRIRPGLPQVGVAPYGQVHAHSTGNPRSTVQNEADYFQNKDINTGFFTHLVGNGRVIQVAEVNRGAWDVGGGWNQWGYASVELIESHKNKDEFMRDYKIYCELLHDLAKQAGLPTTVDQGNTGIITHNYATHNQPNNGSDHVDPIPYLAKWGINLAQFRSDVANAKSNNKPSSAPKPAPAKPSTPSQHDKAIAQSPAKTVNGYTGKMDKFNVQGNKFRVAGWMLPTAGGQPYNYGYVFLLDAKTGKEIARQLAGAVSRPDVTKAYGVKGGTNYGLDVTFDVKKLKGKKFYAMFRRTNDKAGNTAGGHRDIGFKEFYFTL